MAEKINDGGPVFPHEFKYGDGTAQRCEGMTLRDYFAAKALQGICAAPEHLDRIGSFKNAAATAYELADAMLKARETP